MVLDEKFQDLGAAADRLYEIADMAELCGNKALEKAVSDALDRAQRELQEALEALAPAHGEGA